MAGILSPGFIKEFDRNKKMLIGIDLLWVRPNICGGTESATRNLINGFGMYDDKNEYILFVGRDTVDTFTQYRGYSNIRIEICDVDSMKRIKRIAWENSHLDKLARSLNVDMMFIPVYSKPKSLSTEKGGIPYLTMIYDLQALHFPEYFSAARIMFFKRSWKRACETSAKIVTSSNYSKDDITEHFPSAKDKISVIYSPIIVTDDDEAASDKDSQNDAHEKTEEILGKYGVEKDGYYYTVSSMLPHKNLDTLIKVMSKLQGNPDKEVKLLVSGVGGNKEEFDRKVEEAGVKDVIIDTGFVSDEERDTLYRNCSLFLFASTFEGLGMPPVEAMMQGAKVVTTKCASLEEVTRQKANYVDDPTDVDEWIKRIGEAEKQEKKSYTFSEYSLEHSTNRYIELFNSVYNTNN